MLAIVFFTSFIIFYFQLICIQASALVLGSAFNYLVIGLAVLGQTVAASVVYFLELSGSRVWASVKKNTWTPLLLIFSIAGAILFFFFMMTSVNAWLDYSSNPYVIPKRGLVLVIASCAAPHFLFGLLLNLFFVEVPRNQYRRLYFADLAGGGIGAVFSFLFLENLPYTAAIAFPVIVSSVCVFFYVKLHTASAKKALTASLCLLTLLYPVFSFPDGFEPRLSRHLWNMTGSISEKENWKAWTSYAHVSEVALTNAGKTSHYIILGKFEGSAALTPYHASEPLKKDHPSANLCMALGAPDDALVLLAGVGSDMVHLNDYAGGKSRITGVEMNPKVLGAASRFPQYRLKEFFAQKNIKMHLDEARFFLERDKHQYDVILVSWSGATYAYFSGAITQTTKYVYTRQAVESMIKHLKPHGYIVYLDTNKLRILDGVKTILEKKGLRADKAAVVLYREEHLQDWYDPWDEMVLLVKPDGFSASDVKHILERMKPMGYRLAYAPGKRVKGDAWPYGHFLKTKYKDKFLSYLRRTHVNDYHISSDDNPFVFQLFPAEAYFSRGFFREVLFGDPDGRSYQERYMCYVLLILAAAAVFIIGPMLFFHGKSLLKAEAKHFLYFMSAGFGFMFVEIGFMQKLNLLLRSPGYVMTVVLASLVFFAGLGSAVSHIFLKRRILLRILLALLVLYLIFLAFYFEHVIKIVLPQAFFWRTLFAVSCCALAGVPMGVIFPIGLEWVRGSNRALVPWAWVVNGVTGSFASAISPILASVYGFKMVLLLGSLSYLVILLLYFVPKSAGIALKKEL